VAFQITVAFDETTTLEDVDKLFKVFAGGKPVSMITHYIHFKINICVITHDFGVNLYTGPLHGCIYCTRSSKCNSFWIN